MNTKRTALIYIYNVIPLEYWIVVSCLGSFRNKRERQCPKACTSLEVSYGYPFIYEAKKDSSGFITLYFKTTIAVRESHLKYESATLFAEIGGYTGLLLGVSVFDFSKIFSYFCEKIQTFGALQRMKEMFKK